MPHTQPLCGLNLCCLLEVAKSSATDNSPAMTEVVRRFEPLVKKTAWSQAKCHELRQDLMNVGRLAIVKAVRSHEVGQPGFPSYAKAFIHGDVRRERQRWEKATAVRISEDIVDKFVIHGNGGEIDTTEAQPWGDGALADAVAALSNEQQELLSSRYVADATLADIAQHAGTSESAVSQRLRTAHRSIARRLAA